MANEPADLLEDLDPVEFWDDGNYAQAHYQGSAPDDALIESVQAELGYRLPASR